MKINRSLIAIEVLIRGHMVERHNRSKRFKRQTCWRLKGSSEKAAGGHQSKNEKSQKTNFSRRYVTCLSGKSRVSLSEIGFLLCMTPSSSHSHRKWNAANFNVVFFYLTPKFGTSRCSSCQSSLTVGGQICPVCYRRGTDFFVVINCHSTNLLIHLVKYKTLYCWWV